MIIPCGHRVLVKTPEVEEKSEGGIVLVSSERNKKLEKAGKMEGVIIAVGDTAWKHPTLGGKPWAEVGDTVYFSRYGGTLINDPETDEQFVMINDEDVFALIKRASDNTKVE